MVRKRTVVALFISIASLILTNSYWFTHQPISVSANISGVGEYKIEVQLNKKDNDKFNKVRSSKVDINLDETNNVNFKVKNSHKPKRIRFIFSDFESKNPINLSNIQIENTKLDINRFTVQSGDYKFSENSLILYPEYGNIVLTSSEKLSNKAKIKFEIELFISILILSFLFAYKLSDYVANFETIKGKSRIEIIFLTIFFVFLFIPMSHISNEEISIKENRTLAKWKPFIEEKEINYDFGKDFNAWYNDRFALRKLLIKTFHKIQILRGIVETSIAHADLHQNFFYYKPQLMGSYIELSQDELQKDVKNLLNLKKFCDENNIKLYLIIAPQKVNIYKEFLDKNKTHDNPVGVQYEKNMKKHGINYIYPYNSLMEAKKENTDLLHYKSDTHMTDYGMYIVAKEFVNYAQKDFQDIKMFNLDDYQWTYNRFVSARYDNKKVSLGDMNVATVNNEKYLDTQYKEYDIYKKNLVRIKNSNLGEKKIESHIDNHNVFLVGSSYSAKFLKMIAPVFRNIYKIEQNCFQHYSYTYENLYNKILDWNTDILVLIFNEGDAHHYISTMYIDRKED